jgi:hypothetical protein
VTHTANNFPTCTPSDGGDFTTTISRDSMDRPRYGAGRSGGEPCCAPPLAAPAPPGGSPSTTTTVLPWRTPTPKVQANRLRKAASDSALIRRVEEIGAGLAPSRIRPPAADRLGALAARIRAKQGGLPCSFEGGGSGAPPRAAACEPRRLALAE